MITVNALSKSYSRERKVLQSLSFQASPGEITLLVGANGVGKSTTLRILSGLTRPDGGDAVIAGHSLCRSPFETRRHLSFLPQQIAFHPQLTCEAVLFFYAGLRGIADRTARVATLLEQVGLAAEAHKRTHALSGGLRQRLGLAILLLPEVPVLLLDEPGLSLDPEWRERLKELLAGERDRGKTILIATHLLAEWEGAADRALHIRHGGEVASLDPNRLREAFSR
ncbi:MAG TPA: ABC transporter ATP-binding protein [Chthoniobacteraceae bacterium]|nr:ABC transporter ATP-binding protein [Chthoniobacteraceae bacterium]